MIGGGTNWKAAYICMNHKQVAIYAWSSCLERGGCCQPIWSAGEKGEEKSASEVPSSLNQTIMNSNGTKRWRAAAVAPKDSDQLPKYACKCKRNAREESQALQSRGVAYAKLTASCNVFNRRKAKTATQTDEASPITTRTIATTLRRSACIAMCSLEAESRSASLPSEDLGESCRDLPVVPSCRTVLLNTRESWRAKAYICPSGPTLRGIACGPTGIARKDETARRGFQLS